MRNILILLFVSLYFSLSGQVQIENWNPSLSLYKQLEGSEFGLDLGFYEKEYCEILQCSNPKKLNFYYRNYFEGSFFEGPIRAGFMGEFSNLYNNKVAAGVFLGVKIKHWSFKINWTENFKIRIRYDF